MALILASASPRRSELLARITPHFTVQASDFDESAVSAPTPRETALALARGKCLAVAALHPQDLVVGCDTVVECAGQVFGKPRDTADARRMLMALSGADHFVHTGVALAGPGLADAQCFVATTRVRFFPLTQEQIEAYIATPEPYDKAGGYGIQGAAALFCEEIEGDYYNIMGLPVSRLARALAPFLQKEGRFAPQNHE